jgi:hypothetical protein
MLPINPQTSESITAGGGKLLRQSVQEDISAPAPKGTPVPQASTLSQTGNEAGGPVVAPNTWPDPAPAGAAVQAQNPIAIPTNIPADSASIDARSGGSYLTNSTATILAVLALVLAALCVVAKMAQRVAHRRSSISASPAINASMTGVMVKVISGPSMKGSYLYPL